MNDKATMRATAERALDDALMNNVLGERHVEKTIVATYHEDFDRIMQEGDKERPWQSFELTQREDVFEWIKEPSKIAKIQPSLNDLRQLARSLDRPVSILDAGCYGGYVYDYLLRYAFSSTDDFTYTGIDIDPDVVKAASYVHADQPNTTFREADIYGLSKTFAENSFDIVLCSRVLIHIPRVKDALAELLKVSKHAVMAVLEIGDKPRLERIHRRNLDNGVELDYFFRCYSAQELKDVAAELGADYRIIQGPSIYSSFMLYK